MAIAGVAAETAALVGAVDVGALRVLVTQVNPASALVNVST